MRTGWSGCVSSRLASWWLVMWFPARKFVGAGVVVCGCVWWAMACVVSVLVGAVVVGVVVGAFESIVFSSCAQ